MHIIPIIYSPLFLTYPV
jgi:hypothetical protein